MADLMPHAANRRRLFSGCFGAYAEWITSIAGAILRSNAGLHGVQTRRKYIPEGFEFGIALDSNLGVGNCPTPG